VTGTRRGSITASVDVANTGSRAGDEVAQLYLRDPVASLSQPVRRLRGFQRVTLDPGDRTTVSWRLDRKDVGIYDNRGRFVVENGRIDVYVGNTSSQVGNVQSFRVTGGRNPDAGERGGGDDRR
jgi:beta-glucosidase